MLERRGELLEVLVVLSVVCLSLSSGDLSPLLLHHRLRLPPGPVLVLGMLLHVQRPQTLGLVYEGALLHLREELPLGPEPLGDLRVVHLGVLLGHLPPLSPGPDHEGVHGTLDVVLLLVVVSA